MSGRTVKVYGIPAPQGAKTRLPNRAMVEGSSTTGRAKLKNWRSAVAEQAAVVADEQGVTLSGPVSLLVEFRFPVAKARAKRCAGMFDGMLYKTGKPDLDKLLRATGDALVAGGLLARDELIVSLFATKREVAEGMWTGALVEVRDLS